MEIHIFCRPDRDEELIVKKSLIVDSEWDQYQIPKTGAYVDLERTLPYDYNSIMHYGKSFFVKKNPDVSRVFVVIVIIFNVKTSF